MTIFGRSLTARFLLVFISLSVFPLMLTGYMAYHISKETIRQQTIEHLQSVAILKEQQIHSWIDYRRTNAMLLAEIPYIATAAERLISPDRKGAGHEAVHGELKGYLDSLQGLDRDIEEIFILSRAGKVIVSTEDRNRGKIRKYSNYFIEGLKGTFVQNVYYSPSLRKATMTVASPLYRNGSLLGVFACRLNLQRMYEIMEERSGLGETGDTYIVNKYNYFLTESRFGKEYPLRKGIYTWAVQEALKGKDGHGVYKNYREEAVIGTFRWMDSNELAVIAEINLEEAYGQIYSLRNEVMVAGAAIAMASAILIALLIQRLTSPLKQLSMAVKGIGMGEYDQRVDIRGHDEVGVLAGAFNKMAVELKRNVQELNESRDRIRKSLAEKEVLLKEIHHRVKNNMAIVSALLNLQSRYSDDDEINKVLLDCRNRINSMALVHEKLYESKDLSSISVKDYLKELVSHIIKSYSADTIRLGLEIDDVQLEIDRIIPLGLILNELLTNSIKHAFVGNGSPEIGIRLETRDGIAGLTYRDNGPGLPEGMSVQDAESLGLKIAYMLSQQLNGSVALDETDRAMYMLSFPI